MDFFLSVNSNMAQTCNVVVVKTSIVLILLWALVTVQNDESEVQQSRLFVFRKDFDIKDFGMLRYLLEIEATWS